MIGQGTAKIDAQFDSHKSLASNKEGGYFAYCVS